jgi:uncharacterized protein involved in outer membrane biogenesis
VQTTLLGIAIALILALVTALVGPLLVDWDRFRPSIEAEASRLIGAPVRITGLIEAAILPTPSLKLRGLEIGPSHASSSIRMRSLGVELSLGSLVRGQWRAAELHLVGPNFNLGLDSTGQLALPPIAPGFDPDRLSIERLNIEDGHAVLVDARSGSRLSLDKLWFNGDMRSLAGPFKGEGAFVIAGDLYAYRIAAGRTEDGAVKLRLNIDPLDRPLAIEAEGMVAFAGAVPRFAACRYRTADRENFRQRSVAAHQQGEGERGIRPVRRDRISIRAGRTGGETNRDGGAEIRGPAAF